jgi:hypothetical protein
MGRSCDFRGPAGGCYLDTVNRNKAGIMLINTVNKNKSKILALDSTQAKRSRALQRIIARPTNCAYIHCVSMNMIPTCPSRIQDINNAEFSWGPDI